MRAQLDRANALTTMERGVMNEWLDRIAHSGTHLSWLLGLALGGLVGKSSCSQFGECFILELQILIVGGDAT